MNQKKNGLGDQRSWNLINSSIVYTGDIDVRVCVYSLFFLDHPTHYLVYYTPIYLSRELYCFVWLFLTHLHPDSNESCYISWMDAPSLISWYNLLPCMYFYAKSQRSSKSPVPCRDVPILCDLFIAISYYRNFSCSISELLICPKKSRILLYPL